MLGWITLALPGRSGLGKALRNGATLRWWGPPGPEPPRDATPPPTAGTARTTRATQTECQFIHRNDRPSRSVDTEPVEAMELGVFDYINKPFRDRRTAAERWPGRWRSPPCAGNCQPPAECPGRGPLPDVDGPPCNVSSTSLERVGPHHVPPSWSPGDTGPGRKLVAGPFHDLSDAGPAPFVGGELPRPSGEASWSRSSSVM